MWPTFFDGGKNCHFLSNVSHYVESWQILTIFFQFFSNFVKLSKLLWLNKAILVPLYFNMIDILVPPPPMIKTRRPLKIPWNWFDLWKKPWKLLKLCSPSLSIARFIFMVEVLNNFPQLCWIILNVPWQIFSVDQSAEISISYWKLCLLNFCLIRYCRPVLSSDLTKFLPQHGRFRVYFRAFHRKFCIILCRPSQSFRN